MPVPGLIPYPRIGEQNITFSTDTNNVDLWPAAGSPVGAVTLTVYIDPGVTIGSDLFPGVASPAPAFWIRNFPAGSRVYLINRGTILGGGGIGGDGDNGRRDTNSGNTFCGGGGGGGAGSSSQGGLHGPDDSTSATDGSAGTSTTGGAAGANDTSSGESGFVRGAAAQIGGHGIVCGNVDLVIENYGTIAAGANGGEGGYQDGPLPGGEVDAEDGDDLAGDATFVTVSGTEPSAVFHFNTPGGGGYTLEWVTGDTFPDVIGYVRAVP